MLSNLILKPWTLMTRRIINKGGYKSIQKPSPKITSWCFGYDSDADFQVLGGAYERVLGIVVQNTQNRENEDTGEESNSYDDEEEKFVREKFHNFNFPADKDGHFVVVVQNELADVWAECFDKNYGTLRINTRAGKEVSCCSRTVVSTALLIAL